MNIGLKLMRAILLILNVIFLIFGIAVLAIGIWILVDFTFFTKYLPPDLADDEALINGAGAACVSLGVFMLLLCAFGFFGALKKNRLLLTIFAIIMILIMIGTMTAAIVSLIHSDWIESLVEETLKYEVKNNITDGLLKYAADNYECCGIYNIPSCDQQYPGPNGTCGLSSPGCMTGCLDEVWNIMLDPYIETAVIVLFVISGVMAFEIMMAFCVCNAGKAEGYESGYSRGY